MHPTIFVLAASLCLVAGPGSAVERSIGVTSSESRAIGDLRRAAEGGDAEAQWELGVALDMGQGVPAAPAEAVLWFQRAIAGGSSKALVSMAVMLATGRGVHQDCAAAHRLYRGAARMGERHGFYGVGVLHARGEGVPADRQEALAWIIVSAVLGDQQAKGVIVNGAFDGMNVSMAVERARDIAAEFGLATIDFSILETGNAT